MYLWLFVKGLDMIRRWREEWEGVWNVSAMTQFVSSLDMI